MTEWISIIISGIVGIFAILFGVEKRRRKSAEERADRAEAETATVKVESESNTAAHETEHAIEERLDEIQSTGEAQIEQIDQSEDPSSSYNDIVNSFNSKR